MNYHVDVTVQAQKDLKKLDTHTRERILLWLEKNLEGCENPRIIGKALTGNYAGYWRYRIGDYRVIAKIIDMKVIISVVYVGHRSDIYK